jgi:alkanesulfonate monooxygenase SsuD/methylene tetrahydromethanopterin reductase-like flavin-dependent oxidoreductase (luciferase family)
MDLCDRSAVTSFRPALAPPGRLARLGIVLDTRNPAARLGEIARMADRAGIDALWLRDPPPGAAPEARLDALAAVAAVAREVAQARLGVMVDITMRSPTVVAAALRATDGALEPRFEIGFSGGRFEPGEAPDRASRLTEYATSVRRLLSSRCVAPEERPSPGPISWPAGGPPTSIEMRGAPDAGVAVRVGDNVLIPREAIRDVRGAIEEVRRECGVARRDPSSLGIGVELPVSIGRTSAEARARADAEPLFQALGHPAEIGIFGTLEQCQDGVIALAHLGVTELRCVLPNSPDVHDVIAQLTAMVVGTARVLTPNAPRSRPPDPPAGWGGRSSRR